ncbi:MAG: hypothetical protein CSA18_03175 [Deltaproteobacteria bacterium]|nr:MAG: hypothetical protein CSA18_03175 [Deltaproteobacteria bacterium]
MKNILFVSPKENRLKEIANVFLEKKEYNLFFAETGKEVLEKMKEIFFTLAVIDESLDDCSGIELAENIIKTNAMTNTALISSMPDSKFHDITEGLGVLMKLPAPPLKENGIELEIYLKKILGM